MKKLIVLVSLLIVNAQVQAQAWQVRTDAHEGREPGLALGLMAPQFELWAFNLPNFPLYEAGRIDYWQLGESTSVLAGGYVSWWAKTDQWFIEPWSLWRHTASNVNFMSKLAAYVPLDGGPWYLYSDQMAATYRMTETFDLGVAADWWLVSENKPTAGIGAVANFMLGERSKLSVRALKGFGSEPDSLRFEFTLF